MADFNLTSFVPVAAINFKSHRKEDKFSSSLSLVFYDESAENIRDRFKVVVDVRFYWTAQNCYCCLWIWGKPNHASGSGVAGGWEYDKESHCANEAFIKAGATFSSGWGGSGQQSTERAMWQIAKHINPLIDETNATILKANG